ncbi:MAG: FlgD immunoglobulin-like domain containing protein [bacterium]|nr:FlgD immunoglobulin-like domain containing protein [bacterium]
MKRVAFVLSLVAPVLVFAQIQINSSEIPGTVGKNWWSDINTSSTFDVGTAGASKTWNFTSQSTGSDSNLNIITAKTSAPFKDSLAASNCVWRTVNSSATDSNFSYYRLVSDSFNLLGEALNVGGEFKFLRFTPAARMALPLSYGAQWTTNVNTNVTYMSYQATLNIIAHLNVDAYGQIQTPYKTFDCLRVKEYDTLLVIFMSSVVAESTKIVYSFWAENYGVVTKITSNYSETNPNFTTGTLERMISSNIGIEEKNTSAQKTVSLYPNPSYNNVNIKYSLPKCGNVSLKIYDITGNLVRTLVDNSQSVGEHTTLWNGKNTNGTKVPAGIYFYELNTTTDKIRNKIILLK